LFALVEFLCVNKACKFTAEINSKSFVQSCLHHTAITIQKSLLHKTQIITKRLGQEEQ
jgi:hypothetical protein